MSIRYEPPMHDCEDRPRHAGMIYVLMLVVAAAFGGFVWQIYSAPEVPSIAATAGLYEVEAPAEAANAADQGQQAAAPHFAANGPYVAELAALQAEADTLPAWQGLSSRAPQLFAPAQLDVERADLGQRGVYYRVRAGYFAERAQAARFCEHIRQMGQDCIVAAR